MGDFFILDEVVEYVDEGSVIVFEYFKVVFEFFWNYRGKYGLLFGFVVDWNDCINFCNGGESIWLIQFYFKVFIEFIEFCEYFGKIEDVEKYK